jgi:hypothetical protein
MPVWAVWLDEALWFSSSRASRKARNIAAGSRCAIATDDPYEPVVVEGEAELMDDESAIRRFVAAVNEKYSTDYGVEFFTHLCDGRCVTAHNVDGEVVRSYLVLA